MKRKEIITENLEMPAIDPRRKAQPRKVNNKPEINRNLAVVRGVNNNRIYKIIAQ
jgi:hypothetical protein